MNKFYYELSITPNSNFEIFIDIINELTNEAIEYDEKYVLIRSEDCLDDIKEAIEEFSKRISKVLNENIECKIRYEKKENLDWIEKYQKSVKPIVVDNFYVHPSWDKPSQNLINIIIDPKLAFGSGHHETTFSCLEAIGEYVKKDDLILDVGCGSGILAIACKKLGCMTHICDTDKESISSALDNFDKNNISCEKSWIGSCNKTEEKYDLIVANIVADVLIMISGDLKNTLKENGTLIISGIINKYKDKVLSNFKNYALQKQITKNEWVTLVFKKEKNV